MQKTPHKALAKFGDNLRAERDKRAWTQAKLAERADVDQTFISGIERGVRNPTVITIAKLAKALGVSAADLCGGIEK